jgi:hypothetical protein
MQMQLPNVRRAAGERYKLFFIGPGIAGTGSAIQTMQDAQDRMLYYHPRSGKSHHLAHLFAHVRFIAMHRAVKACRLGRLERAPVYALHGIIQQAMALSAESAINCMMRPAVHSYHDFYGAPFTRNAVFLQTHCSSLLKILT